MGELAPKWHAMRHELRHWRRTLADINIYDKEIRVLQDARRERMQATEWRGGIQSSGVRTKTSITFLYLTLFHLAIFPHKFSRLDASKMLLQSLDARLAIASFLPAKEIVRLAETCKTLYHDLMADPTCLNSLVHHIDVPLNSFRQLHFYNVMQESGLLSENRVGFAYGRLELLPDEGDYFPGQPDHEIEIKNSISRLQDMRHFILEQFPDITVHVDSHCGVVAPRSVAVSYSKKRADLIINDFFMKPTPIIPSEHITSTAWGMQVSKIVAPLPLDSHPHVPVADRGWGWAAVFFTLDGLTLPPRPEYYPPSPQVGEKM